MRLHFDKVILEIIGFISSFLLAELYYVVFIFGTNYYLSMKIYNNNILKNDFLIKILGTLKNLRDH